MQLSNNIEFEVGYVAHGNFVMLSDDEEVQ